MRSVLVCIATAWFCALNPDIQTHIVSSAKWYCPDPMLNSTPSPAPPSAALVMPATPAVYLPALHTARPDSEIRAVSAGPRSRSRVLGPGLPVSVALCGLMLSGTVTSALAPTGTVTFSSYTGERVPAHDAFVAHATTHAPSGVATVPAAWVKFGWLTTAGRTRSLE